MTLTAAQRDRACGALLGTAAGDALGAGYEFGPPLAPDAPVDMIGGGLGPFKPGEWTDDTSMAIAIAEIAATGADLRDEQALDYVVRALALVGENRQRRWWADPLGPVRCGSAGDLRANRARRVRGPAQAHRPHRRQRLADADRAGGPCLP